MIRLKKIIILTLLVFLISTPSLSKDLSLSLKFSNTSSNVLNDGTGATTFYSSFADGSAFFYTDLDITSYQGKQLEVTDSGGKVATGYISTAMNSTTYGSNISPGSNCIDPDNDQNNTNGYTASGGAGLASEAGGETGYRMKMTNNAGDGESFSSLLSVTQGKLYNFVVSAGADIGDEYQVRVYGAIDGTLYTSGAVSGQGAGTWDSVSSYITSPRTSSNDWRVYPKAVNNGDLAYFDNLTLKEVTAISGGVQIVSTKGGSTQNWESIESGFNYNNISSIRILQVVEY